MDDRLADIFKAVSFPRPWPRDGRPVPVMTYDEMVFDRFWPLQFRLEADALAWTQAQGLDHRALGLRIGFRDPAHALAFKMRWG